MSCVRLLVIAILMVWFSMGEGGVSLSRDPCPNGKHYGDDWYPSDKYCTRCYCLTSTLQTGYECQTCGVAMIMLSRSECYLDKSNPDDRYPGCCQAQEFCPGDDRYNASKAGINYIG